MISVDHRETTTSLTRLPFVRRAHDDLWRLGSPSSAHPSDVQLIRQVDTEGSWE